MDVEYSSEALKRTSFSSFRVNREHHLVNVSLGGDAAVVYPMKGAISLTDEILDEAGI